MIKVGVVGLGKMGLSHCAILRPHPEVSLVGVCDSTRYVLDVLNKYTGIHTYSDYKRMLAEASLDAVVVATPTSTHVPIVRESLERGIHVFCEKPFTLDPADSDELTTLAQAKGLVTQVGYHNRFVGTFEEVRRLLDAGALGDVTRVLGESYGPVVLQPTGGTWRSRRSQGGGCLYDYAAHVINLVNWYIGDPASVSGTVLNRVFSRETEDEVSSTMCYDGGCSAQISVSWSDESQRKMTTRVTLWGTKGRIVVDRQECQVYLREVPRGWTDYSVGWNVRYGTELMRPVDFYLRGEEYSAQLDDFLQRVSERRTEGSNDFQSAVVTDKVMAMMVTDAGRVGPEPRHLPKARSSTVALGRRRRWRRASRARRLVTAFRSWSVAGRG